MQHSGNVYGRVDIGVGIGAGCITIYPFDRHHALITTHIARARDWAERLQERS